MQLLLGQTAYVRNYGRFPPIELINRFVESDPAQPSSPYTLLARPGTSFIANVGSDPIRGRFTNPGLFGGDLFVVSGETLYRLAADADWNITQTTISGTVANNGVPTFAAMFGDGYEYLFIADGQNLQYYEGLSTAKATLTATAVANGDEVQIDGIYYEFTNTSVDAGSPSGSMANPWLVKLGTDAFDSMQNLQAAMNATGIPGDSYSTNLTQNVNFEGWQVVTSPTRLAIRARVAGVAQNGKSVTETGAGLSWNDTVTAGGGVNALAGVTLPDSKAAGRCASLSGHVLVTVASTNRFYWILPAETFIDPLRTATVEAQPGVIRDLVTYGDQAWFIKDASIEPFYGTEGDEGVEFVPVSGRPISRGGIQGTTIVVDDVVYFLGFDGICYAASTGIERVSDHAIENIVREARAEAPL